MNRNMIRAAVFATGLALAGSVYGQIASDSAENYDPPAWGGGTNEGFGFGAWSLSSTGNGGSYFGNVGDGAIDPAFAIFSPNASSTSTVSRTFNSALTAGDTFSFELAHSPTIEGEIGFQLVNDGDVAITWKFVGGGTGWLMNDGGSDFGAGQAYAANQVLEFSFTYLGGSNYSYTFGSGSGSNFSAQNVINQINEFRFYSNHQGDGQNFGVDALLIIPEPSSILMVGLAGLAAGMMLRRKRG
jgi:hypothetical protein